MRAILDIEHICNAIPIDTFSYVYEHTPKGSLLRELCIVLAIGMDRITVAGLRQGQNGVPYEMLMDPSLLLMHFSGDALKNLRSQLENSYFSGVGQITAMNKFWVCEGFTKH